MGWLRNDHQYLGEPLEFRRLRFRDRAEDPRPGIDHDDPREDDYAPVPWWTIDPSFKNLRSPVPALAGSCSTDAAPASPHGAGVAATSAAGGPGGNRLPAARPNFDTPEAA